MNSSFPRSILVALLAFAPPLLSSAQTTSPARRPPAPLGLLRLETESRPGRALALAAGTYAIDDRLPAGVAGGNKGQRSSIDVLALDAGAEWSRPLRGSAHPVSFISFQLHASSSTIVDLGGARLGFVVSLVDGSVQLVADESAAGLLEWKSLNYHVGTKRYDGKTMAALPTLTGRLEPDTNANGIDDRFELEARGVLLAADAPVTVRSMLAQEWKAAQRRQADPALYASRPLPDRP